ncbi:uncharacterized protein LOC123297726 [Chrysoperla carnea]|uniref:uncharacterized protein LOC123297726 n=1 Tax=Chrysoperla carnea TaxID=189513 RepID=UPI001D063F18|nr:uncharacterized protein LOC123297726 [Chrysoperla carnea]
MSRQSLIYILYFIIIAIAECYPYKFNSIFKNRDKRSLIYPEGDPYIQYILGIGLPIELQQQSITIGTVGKFTYRVPKNSSIFTQNSVVTQKRKKRAPPLIRWNIYDILSKAAESLGLGGKACVLLTICETAETPFDQDHGMIEELLHVVFTPSTTSELISSHSDNEYFAAEMYGRNGENCKKKFPDCQIHLLDLYTRTR